MPTKIDGTLGVIFPDNSSQNTAATGFGFKNRIINGSMMIDQRNAGASYSAVDGTYSLDRWKCQSWDSTAQTGKYTVQQNAASVTPPAGYVNYLGITSSAATTVGSSGQYMIGQNIEGLNVGDLAWGTANAATVTLSFWVRSSLTGTFGGSLSNSAVNRSYPFTFVINSANTWEQKSVIIAGDTSGTWLTTNGIGIRLNFGLGVGASVSGTAGSWAGAAYYSATGATSVVGTNGATFYITGVQLEKGSTATSFDYRPYGTELALCQRYYEIAGYGITGTWQSSSIVQTGWNFKVEKRASPTTTLLKTNMVVTQPSVPGDYTASGSAITASDGGIYGKRVIFNGFTGATAGVGAIVLSDAWAAASAEL